MERIARTNSVTKGLLEQYEIKEPKSLYCAGSKIVHRMCINQRC